MATRSKTSTIRPVDEVLADFLSSRLGIEEALGELSTSPALSKRARDRLLEVLARHRETAKRVGELEQDNEELRTQLELAEQARRNQPPHQAWAVLASISRALRTNIEEVETGAGGSIICRMGSVRVSFIPPEHNRVRATFTFKGLGDHIGESYSIEVTFGHLEMPRIPDGRLKVIAEIFAADLSKRVYVIGCSNQSCRRCKATKESVLAYADDELLARLKAGEPVHVYPEPLTEMIAGPWSLADVLVGHIPQTSKRADGGSAFGVGFAGQHNMPG